MDTRFADHLVKTDQPIRSGGTDSAPSPFALFLASIGACAGYYVLAFCQSREISTEGISLIQEVRRDPSTGMIDEIEIAVQLPSGFPEKYQGPLIRAVELCSVKKHLEMPPQINIRTETVSPSVKN